ncbi:MAG: hydrogenase formation protein HypD [Candidatus Hodarchaeales archaeon]|jgi:hydrogenase expression/formation protein HypD
MKSYQDPEMIKKLSHKISELAEKLNDQKVKICHVCGTHEFTISHWGIRSLLPPSVEVIAGPGCPVCVCPNEDIEQAIWLAKNGYILTTFGDMSRVPSSKGSLLTARAEGASIQIVYSFIDVIKLAKKNPTKNYVFFSIGFETTAPIVAIELINRNLPSNVSILSSHRLVPPAMELLMEQVDIQIDGFIAPGHVSTITGSDIYKPITSKNDIPIVISGFEPVDVMMGIMEIMQQLIKNKPRTANLYTRVVTPQGNKKAQEAIDTAYQVIDAKWRGIGIIPRSGLEIASHFDAVNIRLLENIPISGSRDIPKGCRCADVILGKIYPSKCSLFNTKCTPENPIGPCMVGTEGTCAIHAQYGGFFRLEENE